MNFLAKAALFAVPLTLALGGSVAAEEWGTIKGQITWGGQEPPPRVKLDVNKDQVHCLGEGPIYSEEYVVGKGSGVKNVFVWLIDAGNPKKKLPIHPSLLALKDKEVVLDQPHCRFEPHALILREGQVLLARNSSPVVHNLNWQGGADNPGDNKVIPANGQFAIENLKASSRPLQVSCNIHTWMSAWIRVFDHPYYVLTDAEGRFEIKKAPAGKYNLVMWHEGAHWIGGGKTGKTIDIPANGTVEVKEVVKPPER